jgi:hypothetical protein
MTVLMPLVARRYVQRRAVPIATALFALAEYLLYYSAEIKQYSCDVMFTLLALLLAHQRRDWLQEGRASVEAYLTEQPMLREDPEAILDLIYHEILLREEHGESPRLEE